MRPNPKEYTDLVDLLKKSQMENYISFAALSFKYTVHFLKCFAQSLYLKQCNSFLDYYDNQADVNINPK